MSDRDDASVIRTLIWAIAWVLMIFFLSISGCVMHNDSVKAVNTAAQVEQIKAQNQLSTDKNQTILELIDKGTNPIAARCAIEGFQGTDLCGMFVTDPSKVNLD